MSERRFVLVDFIYKAKTGRHRLFESGHTCTLPRAIAHAATKRELVAKQRPLRRIPRGMFQPPEVLTELEVIEAEAELRIGVGNAVDGSDFSRESRFGLFGPRLLFFVRLDDRLRRTFWRGLLPRRALTLWA